MAGLKEIKRRLDSVKNTKKITYAMKLVAAAKLRKAQESVAKSRGYSDALTDLLRELVRENEGSDFDHPLLAKRETVKNVGLLVIGGSRGLCGGYNSNINRKVEAFHVQYKNAGIPVVANILSRKPAEYYRRVGRSYNKSYETLPEDALLWPIDDVCRELEQDFIDGKIDEVYMIYTKFKSAMSMTVTTEKLLPMEAGEAIERVEGQSKKEESKSVTLFEPSVNEVFSQLIPRIMRSRVRQASLDAKASEYGSRMTAMESATKNAGDLIKKLQLKFNKLRQTRITSELLDILGGSEATK